MTQESGRLTQLSLLPLSERAPNAGRHSTMPPTNGQLRSVPPPPPSSRTPAAKVRRILGFHLGDHPLRESVERIFMNYVDELVCKEGLLMAELTRATSLAAALPVLVGDAKCEVMVISGSNPRGFSNDWLTPEALELRTDCPINGLIRHCVAGPIGSKNPQSLAMRIRAAHALPLLELHTASQIERAVDDVRSAFVFDVGTLIERKCKDFVGLDSMEEMVDTVIYSMAYLILYAMAYEDDAHPYGGDQVLAFGTLLVEMLGSPIVGEKRDEPGVWLAIAK